jgi:PhzF family phenazine biosynthesis protein
MKIGVNLVKSFTKDKSAGNPTGIVLNADNLNETQMQNIAKKLNFAESVFIMSSTEADFRLRFFAPNHEVDLCGHGTIATFHILLEQGIIGLTGQAKNFAQETRAGVLSVTCHEDGRVIMAQKSPEFGEIEKDRARIATLLSISSNNFVESLPLQIVSTGTPKLLIPLRDLKAVRDVKPDIEGIKEYSRTTAAKGFYPFTAESPITNTDFFTRQFNPLADENEDPVTGVAAGALGCYAQKYNLYGKTNYVVAQGYDLGKGGNVFVDVSNGVKVGGYAVSYGQQILEV